MNTTAHVTISTEQKLENLRVALDALRMELSREGRYIAASHVDTAEIALWQVARFHSHVELGHD